MTTEHRINAADALTFYRHLFGQEPTEWRPIHPRRAPPGNVRHIWGWPESEAQLGALADYNREGFGVFTVINVCSPEVERRCNARGKERGGARNIDITGVRAFFADLDSEDYPGQNREKLATAPLPPSLVVRSSLPQKLQAYWRLVPGNSFPVADFTRVQKGLVRHFNSDEKVVNPARVMRVPGFYHTKGEPILSALLEAHEERVYTPEQVMAAFGIPLVPPARPQPAARPLTVRGGHRQARYVWAAVQGEHDTVAAAKEGTRNDTLHKAAVKLGSLVGAGVLPEADARDVLELASEKCGLPDHEAQQTITSGLTYGMAHPRDLQGRS